MAKKGKGAFGDRILDETPDTDTVPDGGYLVKIKKMVVGSSKQTSKKMYTATEEIERPKEYKGILIYDRFVVGTDDDPDGNSDAIYNTRGAKQLKKLIVASGAQVRGKEDEEFCDAFEGLKAFAVMTQSEQKEGDYKGKLQNNIQEYFEPGSREPEVTGAVPKAAKAKSRPAAAAEEEEEEEEEEEAPKPKKKPTPPVADDDDEEEEDDEDEDEEEDEEEEKPRKKAARR